MAISYKKYMIMNEEISNNKFYGEVKNNLEKINIYLIEKKNKKASELCDETFNMIKNYKSFNRRIPELAFGEKKR